MSEEQKVGRLQFLQSAITGKGPQIQNQYARLNIKAVIPPFFTMRMEILLREKIILNDDNMDIADRVQHADDLLTVIGQSFGHGGEKHGGAWTTGYNYFQDYLPGWRKRIGRRSWYRVERLARVRDWIEIPEPVEQEDGTTLVKMRRVPVVRQIHEETWAAREMLDKQLRDSEQKEKDWKSIEFLGWVQQKDERILQILDQQGYDISLKEQALLIEGTKLITRAMKVLNLNWRDIDMPNSSGDVFLIGANQGQQGRTMEYPSQSVQGSSAQTGVHK
jgi:hypothetical protein